MRHACVRDGAPVSDELNRTVRNVCTRESTGRPAVGLPEVVGAVHVEHGSVSHAMRIEGTTRCRGAERRKDVCTILLDGFFEPHRMSS